MRYGNKESDLAFFRVQVNTTVVIVDGTAATSIVHVLPLRYVSPDVMWAIVCVVLELSEKNCKTDDDDG